MADTPGKKLEQVLETPALKGAPKERLATWYKDKLQQKVKVDLDKLEKELQSMSIEQKIVALIIRVSGIEEAKKTPAWKALTPDQRHKFEHAHDGGHRHESGHETEITSLRREIDNMLKKDDIANVPGSARLIAEYKNKLSDPSLTADTLKKIRDSLNQLQLAVAGFSPKNAQDIIDKIQSYNESRTEKNNEGNMLLYGALVKEIYNLGYRLRFERGNVVKVTGGSEPTGADQLEASLSGKPMVIDWMKRGMVINTSHWTSFMNSYPSESTATVEKYIATYGEGKFTSGSMDADFLASARAGGFDIQGHDRKWITRGMNVHNVALAAQQAAKKWKEMGYQTPLQKSNPRMVKFADLAYNVAKFGFAAASVWKGTKALWKTIFGDEAAMKAAWGDFGKTLAWTGAVWYGGEAVKNFANDIKGEMDLPNYVESLQSLSSQDGKYGVYDGFQALWRKIGGSLWAPGVNSTAGMIEAFMPSTVPFHQYKEMFEILCTGRKGDDFLKADITDLSKALDNAYHTKSGSHVGGLREFFYDMGSWGKDVYDKFLIDRKTGDKTRKFLRALADYRSEESFTGANDAISDRNQPISVLFASPLAKETEVPADFHDEIDAIKKAWSKTGRSAIELGLVGGAFLGDVVHLAIDGIKGMVEFPMEKWKSMNAEQKANVIAGIRTLGLGAATGLMFTFGPGGWIGVALKSVLGGATGLSLWDNFKGFINFDTGEILEGTLKTLIEKIIGMSGLPPELKAALEGIIKSGAIDAYALKKILDTYRPQVTDPVLGGLLDVLGKFLDTAPSTGGGNPAGGAPGGSVPPPPLPSDLLPPPPQ